MEECQDRRPVVFISGAGVKKEIPDELEKFCHVVQWNGKEPISSQDMKNGIRNADILVLAFHSRLDREEVQEAARLKLVIQNFAGYERVDVQACTEFGIPFCNAASPSGSTVAEMALTLILASRRQLLSYVDAMRAGQWVHSPNNTWDEAIIWQDIRQVFWEWGISEACWLHFCSAWACMSFIIIGIRCLREESRGAGGFQVKDYIRNLMCSSMCFLRRPQQKE